jgi:hypothetical protein
LPTTLTRATHSRWLRALTMKVVNDANDVIEEITLNGGRQMWTEALERESLAKAGERLDPRRPTRHVAPFAG